MQAQLNFTFDLGTASGRAEFQRMFQHLLTPTLNAPVNPSSIPADPDRAEAARAGRQEAAAKARAAKAAKQAPGPVDLSDDGPNNMPLDAVADLTGPEPDGDGAEVEDLGLIDPNMSPAEAKEAGLVIVREAYAAGKVAEVKKLQKAWGIAKFYDIPTERGHEFYQQVVKLAHETGLRK